MFYLLVKHVYISCKIIPEFKNMFVSKISVPEAFFGSSRDGTKFYTTRSYHN